MSAEFNIQLQQYYDTGDGAKFKKFLCDNCLVELEQSCASCRKEELELQVIKNIVHIKISEKNEYSLLVAKCFLNLGHRDVKTTITVYNSVDSEYIRQTTDKFNERVKEDQMLLNDKKREEILEQRKDEFVADMDDDEFDEILTKLLEERKERKRRRESDMEM